MSFCVQKWLLVWRQADILYIAVKPYCYISLHWNRGKFVGVKTESLSSLKVNSLKFSLFSKVFHGIYLFCKVFREDCDVRENFRGFKNCLDILQIPLLLSACSILVSDHGSCLSGIPACFSGMQSVFSSTDFKWLCVLDIFMNRHIILTLCVYW